MGYGYKPCAVIFTTKSMVVLISGALALAPALDVKSPMSEAYVRLLRGLKKRGDVPAIDYRRVNNNKFQNHVVDFQDSANQSIAFPTSQSGEDLHHCRSPHWDTPGRSSMGS